MTADPSGMVDSINLYTYCQNKPINRLDSEGQKSKLARAIYQFHKGLLKRFKKEAKKAAIKHLVPGGHIYSAIKTIKQLPEMGRQLDDIYVKEGAYMAAIQLDPAFHTMVSAHKTVQSIEKEKYEAAGLHAFDTGLHSHETVETAASFLMGPRAPASTARILTKAGERLRSIAKNVSETYRVEQSMGMGLGGVRISRRAKPSTPQISKKSTASGNVPRDWQGHPVFESLHDVVLPDELIMATDYRQMRYALRKLEETMKANPHYWENFSKAEQRAIKSAFKKGTGRIKGFRWHHHAVDVRILQLVESAHHKVGHIGSTWILGRKR
jgi:hypothetical protein